MRKQPGRFASAFYRYRTEGDGPIRQSLAIGLGLYIGASPFIGFHWLLALALGGLFRLNRLKVYLAANISNPLIAPFLFAAEIQVGAKLRTGHFISAATLEQVRLKGIAIDILLGSVVVGLALGIAGTLLTLWAVRRQGDDVWVAGLVDAAAERYLAVGVSAWEFARGKLRMDPVYLQLLKDGYLPSQGQLLDLGCGAGLMLSLLASARDRASAGLWPPSWPAPPSGLRLRGVELRSRAARHAREALEGVAEIEEQDLAEPTLTPCDVVLIFDVLHLMTPDAQTRLLDAIAKCLAPHGLLIVREANASGGWRFAMVRLGNRITSWIHGRRSRRFAFDTAAGWHARLEQSGFSVDSMVPQKSGAFANVLIYARSAARQSPALARISASRKSSAR